MESFSHKVHIIPHNRKFDVDALIDDLIDFAEAMQLPQNETPLLLESTAIENIKNWIIQEAESFDRKFNASVALPQQSHHSHGIEHIDDLSIVVNAMNDLNLHHKQRAEVHMSDEFVDVPLGEDSGAEYQEESEVCEVRGCFWTLKRLWKTLIHRKKRACHAKCTCQKAKRNDEFIDGHVLKWHMVQDE